MKKAIVSSAAAAMILSVVAPYPAYATNPYLPLWEHLPDGEPRVFEDPDNPGKYRVYIIGSHDVRYDDYCGVDIRAWSAPVEDLNDWRDEGPIFTYQEPVTEKYDIMFAPDLVEVLRRDENGERTIREYYLYPHSRGPGREAMVAKSSRPTGPFEIINMGSDGRMLLPGSVMGFDPSVYIEYIDDPSDPDYDIGFRAYGYWGFQKSHAAELNQETMYSVRPGTQVIQFFIPASNSYGDIRDPEGTQYPYVFPGQDLGAFNFFEAASIRKVGNKYVWVYSGYSGPEYGIGSANATLRYAYGDTPLGPWKSGGVLVDARAPVVNENGTALVTSYSGHNTHGSIEEINGQWYVFYHRAPRGFGYARQPMVAPVHITYDEASVANGGKVVIKGWEAPGNPMTVSAGGNEYTGAEVTSEGFNINGLDPLRYYSAGIACYLSNQGSQADAWDIWDDHAPITNVTHGSIIGYKYFNFDGLSDSDKDTLAFNLFLQPIAQREFTISVWLDAPWNNSTHNGTKIGEITVPSESGFEISSFSAIFAGGQTPTFTGKHAIYLVAEGASGPLCNLIGLGFSADGKETVRPVPPQVSIKIDGVPLNLPDTPVRANEFNGITDYCTYDVDASLPDGVLDISKISADSNFPDMDISIHYIEQDGYAISTFVEFDYNGMVKTYNLQFGDSPKIAKPVPQDDEDAQDEQTGDGPQTAETAENDPASEDSKKPSLMLPILGGAAIAAAIGAGLYYTATVRRCRQAPPE